MDLTQLRDEIDQIDSELVRLFGQRMDVAVLLSRGENYQNIAQQAGVSTATISRVSRCLNYGSGGYRQALEKLGEGTK